MSDSYFHALKNRTLDSHQMDTDGIASCLKIIAQQLERLKPGGDAQNAGVFTNITNQLQAQLETLRARRVSAYEFFAGRGVVARKLREHLFVNQWLDPGMEARNAELSRQLEDTFNKRPIKDEAALQELTDFIKMTVPLMVGQTLEGQEFNLIDPNVPLPTIKTGFYKLEGPVLTRQLLVLNTCTDDITVSYVLESGREEVLLYQHPEEDEWFRTDYTFTFEGVVKKLQAELDRIIAPMGFSASMTDLDAEMARITGKVNRLFDQQTDLPHQGFPTVSHSRDETQIKIPVGPTFYWVFIDTRGKYPSRTNRFFRRVGDSIQSAQPTELNEFSRQNMIKLLDIELDKLAKALESTQEVVSA
jgi:hypothetical protein